MQISPEQLLAEAGEMALQIRFLEKQVAALQAELAALRAVAPAAGEGTAGG